MKKKINNYFAEEDIAPHKVGAPEEEKTVSSAKEKPIVKAEEPKEATVMPDVFEAPANNQQNNNIPQTKESPAPEKENSYVFVNEVDYHVPEILADTDSKSAKNKRKKELRNLSRNDLLELLLAETKENERLAEENLALRRKLEDYRINIESCGSMAEAALKLSGVFKACDEACRIFTDNAKQKADEKGIVDGEDKATDSSADNDVNAELSKPEKIGTDTDTALNGTEEQDNEEQDNEEQKSEEQKSEEQKNDEEQ